MKYEILRAYNLVKEQTHDTSHLKDEKESNNSINHFGTDNNPWRIRFVWTITASRQNWMVSTLWTAFLHHPICWRLHTHLDRHRYCNPTFKEGHQQTNFQRNKVVNSNLDNYNWRWNIFRAKKGQRDSRTKGNRMKIRTTTEFDWWYSPDWQFKHNNSKRLDKLPLIYRGRETRSWVSCWSISWK